jgi:hypothetical protein
VSHVIFGLVSGACFFIPGLKYFRQRGRAEDGFRQPTNSVHNQ